MDGDDHQLRKNIQLIKIVNDASLQHPTSNESERKMLAETSLLISK